MSNNTNEQFYFVEQQRYTKKWILWLVGGFFVLIVGFFGTLLYMQFVLGTPVGNNPMSDTSLIASSAVAISTTGLGFWLFRKTSLSVKIGPEGIVYRYSPYHFREYLLKPEEIKKAYVRSYSPLKEYGGWGMRRSFKNGRAYNVEGTQGIQLELKDGNKILFGTQKPQEAEKALKKAKLA